jgi:hypothetical protein
VNTFKRKWSSAVLVAGLAIAAGCATSNEVAETALAQGGERVVTDFDKAGNKLREERTSSPQALYYNAVNKGPESAKILEIDCGTAASCFTGRLTVYAPAGGSATREIRPPAVAESDGWKIWREVKELAIGVSPWIAGAYTLNKAFGAAAQAINTTTSTNVTATGAGSSAAAGGSATGSYSSPATTTTTTTTTSNSNNRNCNSAPGAAGGAGGTGTTTGGNGAPGGAGGPATC